MGKDGVKVSGGMAGDKREKGRGRDSGKNKRFRT
jgi:hypothetical protein